VKQPSTLTAGFRRPRLSWILLLFLALGMAGYAAAYFVVGQAMFPGEVAESFIARPWGIYPHAFFGIFAIAIGPFQFLSTMIKRRKWHRWLGKVYLIAALGTGISGFYMAVYSYGGWVTHLGFGGMAASMILTTLVAYLKIRAGNVRAHREWMIRSYAVMFSAVTFRAWLGLLTASTGGEFLIAYGAASWLSWVLNLVWAEFYLRRTFRATAVRSLVAEMSAVLARDPKRL
jgi:uncharacterized membrane protein